MVKLLGKALAGTLVALALAALAGPAQAQLPASPRRFVDNLDVRCYQINDQPPLNVPLALTHLNPVLVGMGLPVENVVLGSPQDLCVPVSKNNVNPPNDTLPFIRFIDWKCYGIQGPPLNLPLTVSHLNPNIPSSFPKDLNITVLNPVQLCVPVVKNNSNPPAFVQALVQHLDVKCYNIAASQTVSAPITLKHLNPLPFFAALPAEVSTVGPNPDRLCVPVRKNNAAIPAAILPFIQYSDVLCYPATGNPLGVNLALKHLNPVLVAMGLPIENVFVTNSRRLCVPVAKNGVLPPGMP
jgi:hypothetical protein